MFKPKAQLFKINNRYVIIKFNYDSGYVHKLELLPEDEANFSEEQWSLINKSVFDWNLYKQYNKAQRDGIL